MNSANAAILASAPYKVSLAGEHAVGYGGSSIVAAAHTGLRLALRDAEGDHGWFRCGQRRERWTSAGAAAFRRLVDDAFRAHGADAWRTWAEDYFAPLRYLTGALAGHRNRPFDISTGGTPWAGGGLGTSSGIAAALAAALDARFGRARNAVQYTRLIRQSDRLRHGGRPSGVDGAVVVRGGVLRFRSGRCQLLPAPAAHVLLIDSGVSRDANRVIAWFATRGARQIDAYVKHMEEVVGSVTESLTTGDLPGLFRALEAGGRLMMQFGLGCPAGEDLFGELRRRGARAVKLTGAGCGGVAVAFFAGPIPGQLQADLRSRGIRNLATVLGANGCVVERSPPLGGLYESQSLHQFQDQAQRRP